MKTDMINWNKSNNVFVFDLPILFLNHLHTYNECTRFLCPVCLCGAAYMLLVAITKINVRALHVNFTCSCVQTHEFLKNTRVELHNTHVLPTCMFKV